MIIFLYGTDGYRLNQNKETIIKSYRAKHASGLNLSFIDCNHDKASHRLEDIIKNQSFFKEVKLTVLSDVFSSRTEEIYDLLKKYEISSDKDCVVLAIHKGTPSEAKNKEFFAYLSDEKNLVRYFEPLTGAKLTAWIRAEAAERSAIFEASALRQFLLSGTDSWQHIHNLEKLANYCQGKITEADVNLLVNFKNEPNIFECIEAVARRDLPTAFQLLYSEFAHGQDPYYLLTMIVYQFRNMLVVKDLLSRGLNLPAIAKQSGLHPFVVRKVAALAGRFSMPELKQNYHKFLDLELGSKNGNIDLTDHLYSFVLAS